MLKPPPELITKAETLLHLAKDQGCTISTAESCTGGLISAVITSISGASSVFNAGLVTYSNSAKSSVLNVPEALIEKDGAVSESVALAMAEGACKSGQSTMGIAVTGIAGPTGGTPEKPVGLVHIAVAYTGMKTVHTKNLFRGSRDEIRMATVSVALTMSIESLKIRQNI